MPIDIPICGSCGLGAFPARLRCPRCGSFDFHPSEIGEGTVLTSTTLLHVAGRQSGAPVRLGTIGIMKNVSVVARLADGVQDGDRVTLASEAGAVIAKKL